MLSNPIYIGTLRWHVDEENRNIENVIPAIIEKDIFQRVQEIQSRKRAYHPRTVSSSLIFSGICKCARCGGSLTGTTVTTARQTKYKYYICNNSKRGTCDLPRIRESKISKILVDQILRNIDLSFESEWFPDERHEKNTKDEIDSLLLEMAKIQKRRRNWQRLLADEEISLKDYKEQIKDTATEAHINERILQLITEGSPARSIEDIIEALKHIAGFWEVTTDNEKKDILKMLIDELSIDFDPVTKSPLLASVSFF